MSGVQKKQTYKSHPLPDSCPPGDSEVADGVFLRLVAKNPAEGADFLSGHAEGKTKPGRCDDCRWMACSVFVETTSKHKIAGFAKLPKLSHKKFLAYIKVDSSCGRVKPHDGDAEHVSFWMFDSFQPEKAILKIEPL